MIQLRRGWWMDFILMFIISFCLAAGVIVIFAIIFIASVEFSLLIGDLLTYITGVPRL